MFCSDVEADVAELHQAFLHHCYGAYLVACQAFLVGSVSDIKKKKETGFKKNDAFSAYPPSSRGSTLIELLNALANYYKHVEEGGDLHSNTERILKEHGLDFESDDFLANGMVYIQNSYNNQPIYEMLQDWQHHLNDKWA